MREVERYGVKMDICQTSGGIWLDKGELEKIIMMIREEALEDGGAYGGSQAQSYERAPAYDDRHASRQQRPQKRKRESVFENIMDIFDL